MYILTLYEDLEVNKIETERPNNVWIKTAINVHFLFGRALSRRIGCLLSVG
jgi:hypothetical protein